MLMMNHRFMSNFVVTSNSLQTAGAYLGSLVPGVYIAASYTGIAAKMVFVLIPVLALKIARARTRTTSDVIRFPAETASASTQELAVRDLDFHSRYIDIISHAS
jgi:hypothetical protein